MSGTTDDLRIREIRPLITPNEVIGEFPADERVSATVAASRKTLHRIIHGQDDRLEEVI